MRKTLKERFEQYEDEFLKFEREEGKLSRRADLHAFLLLDQLCPSVLDLVGGAGHDEIWFSVDLDKVHEVATDAQVLSLVRSGVRVDEDVDALCMFV